MLLTIRKEKGNRKRERRERERERINDDGVQKMIACHKKQKSDNMTK